MKATLRQEGLLSKLKSDRAEPVHLALDEHSDESRKRLEEEALPLENKENRRETKIYGTDTLKTTDIKDEEPKKLRIDNQGPEIVSARGIPGIYSSICVFMFFK